MIQTVNKSAYKKEKLCWANICFTSLKFKWFVSVFANKLYFIDCVIKLHFCNCQDAQIYPRLNMTHLSISRKSDSFDSIRCL